MPSSDPAIKKKHRDRWYRDNKAAQIARQRERKKELREWFADYKRKLYCTDCKMSFVERPECCDFHHLDPAFKEEKISNLVVKSKKALLKEIVKCVPLCANCHRTRHTKMDAEAAKIKDTKQEVYAPMFQGLASLTPNQTVQGPIPWGHAVDGVG